jgi:hypothetical protein
MRITKLLCLPLLAVSINALAYQVINEKTTSTPGFNFQVEHVSNSSMVKKTFSPEYASAMAWAYDAQGRPMEYIKIQGDHNITITNDTSKRARYTYTYTLRCLNASGNYERTVDLAPHETFTGSSHNYGTVQEGSEGSYNIRVTTSISGAENSAHTRDATLRIKR